MENHKQYQSTSKSSFAEQNQENPAKGLNEWNDRLDANLEPEQHGDTLADERANDFSDEVGSGDQSDQSEG